LFTLVWHIASKKKKESNDDDLFGGGGESLFGDEGDLFGSSTSSSNTQASVKPAAASSAKAKGTAKTTAKATSASTTPETRRLRGRLTYDQRVERFNSLLQFVDEHIGRNPPAKAQRKPEQVRDTAWQHLFDLAMTKEQMEQITAIMPKWRESRRKFTDRTAEAFVRTLLPLLSWRITLTSDI
jgi:hypothetical protein